MEIELRELVNGWQSVQALASTKFPAALSFRLARAMRALSAVYEDYERQRVDLIKEHGVEREGGNGWHIPADDTGARDRYQEELDALLDETVTVSFRRVPAAAVMSLNGDAEVEPGAIVGAWFLFDGE